jgi:hypothetical protein
MKGLIKKIITGFIGFVLIVGASSMLTGCATSSVVMVSGCGIQILEKNKYGVVNEAKRDKKLKKTQRYIVKTN